ncbi:MAG: DUF1566 domain-containing protein [Nitrospirae bacterium]|nr:DUF1566 domain-containing protein [Nitrospirota bacterium]
MQKKSLLFVIAVLALILPVIAMAAVSTTTPLQTGQRHCDNGAGTTEACSGGANPAQDAFYRTGISWPSSRFTLVTSGSTAGTVVDNVTGLVWAGNTAGLPTYSGVDGTTTLTFTNAILYIGYLNSNSYLGITTWRLPNIIELTSLVNRDYAGDTNAVWTAAGLWTTGSASNAAWLTAQGFPTVTAASYWSSTSVGTTLANAWVLDMTATATTGDLHSVATAKTSSVRVLPVSGTSTVLPKTGQTLCYTAAGAATTCGTGIGSGQDGDKQAGVSWPATRFTSTTLSGNTCVTDNITGLMWSATGQTGATWTASLAAIAVPVSYCGFTDWRLANINEMFSLIHFGQTMTPAAWLQSQGFASSVTGTMWSSTTHQLTVANALTMDLSTGAVTSTVKTPGTNAYMLVRKGRLNVSGSTNNSAWGTVSCDPTSLEAGSSSSSTCTMTPATGYQLSSAAGAFVDNGVNATATGTYTGTTTYSISNITASHRVGATFTIRNYTVSGSVVGTERFATTSAACGVDNAGTTTDAAYNYGTTQVCSFTLDSGYAIKSFTDNGTDKLSSLVGGTTYTMTMTGNHTLVFEFATGYPISASVTGTGGTISCSPSTVASGNSSVCTITPDSGYALSTLTDNSSNVYSQVVGGTSYTLTNVTTSHTIVATFGASYTVTGAVTGGNGTISCVSPVATGTTSTCTITPNAGYALQSLDDGGTNGLTSATATWNGASYSYTTTAVTSNRTVTAAFGTAYSVTASVTGTGGAISCTPSRVLSGQSSTCTITPSTGNTILSLVDNGSTVTSSVTTSDNVTYTYTISNVTANHTVSVMFATGYSVVTSVASGSGTISCSPTSVASGGTIVCTITPGSGQQLLSLTDNSTNVTSQVSGSTYTISNVTSNHSIVATFSGVSTSYGIVLKGDFSGDGISDVLWIDSNSGMMIVWFMSAGTYTSSTVYGYAPSGWTVKGIGDFNADGRADLLWQNTSTGALAIWLTGTDGKFASGGPVTFSSVPMVLGTTSWNFLGTADFTASGKKQTMVWQSTSSGVVVAWQMNGNAIVSATTIAIVDSIYSFKGMADFSGDGVDDFVWQSPSSGQIVMWVMNGTAIGSGAVVATLDSSWTYKGAAAFDGGTKAQILWQNAAGLLAMWTMNGASFVSSASPGTVDSSWIFKGLGKFDSGATYDILWQNTSGLVATWLMSGSSMTSAVGSGVWSSNYVIQ